MKTQVFSLIFLSIIILSVSSCTQCGNTSTSIRVTHDVTEYPLMTSYEITKLINEQGIIYNIGITNEIENVSKYITDDEKALGLGVYGADLAYLTTYNMKKETVDYLKVIKELYSALEIDLVDKELLTQFEDNIDQKDSLIMIVQKMYNDTYALLKRSGKNRESILIIAGAWIEGMFIITQAGQNDYSVVLSDAVLKQRNHVDTLRDLFEKSIEDPSIAAIKQDFDPVFLFFDRFETDSTQKSFIELGNAVEVLRNKIIH